MDGDEFSNNLFSDLAPLLALFGERVATQYLRHSTHWLENLIFACAPLGLLTAVSAAIRVGGERNLKALIGRAEETEAQAEIELMSSTSADTCELWNGSGLVRVVGEPQLLEVVYDEEWAKLEAHARRHNGPKLHRYHDTYGLFTRHQGMIPVNTNTTVNPSLSFEDDSSRAPNISMNTIGDINKTELRIIALIGVFVQLAVLGFDGIVTYRWGWGKGGYPVATYAFPLTLIGTLSVVVGMYLCANIVETKTQEIDWRRGTGSGTEYKPRKIQIIWLQKSQTVGDQRFKAFAIYAPAAADRIYLKTSHKKATTSRTLHSMTVAASVVSITGFILQFVGIRAMHFSASIAQLIATAIMTILRVFIRRHISKPHKSLYFLEDVPSNTTFSIRSMKPGHEIDNMAMQLQGCREWQITTTTRKTSEHTQSQTMLGEDVLGTRMRIASLLRSPWHTRLHERGILLSSTISALTNLIWNLHTSNKHLRLKPDAVQLDKIACRISVETAHLGSNTSVESLTVDLQREKIDKTWMPWKIDEARVDALLHLWSLQLRNNLDMQEEDPKIHTLWLLCSPNDKMGIILANWWMDGGYNFIKDMSLREICNEFRLSLENGDPNYRYAHVIHPLETNKNASSSAWQFLAGDSLGSPESPQDLDIPISSAIIREMSLTEFCTQYILYVFVFEISKFIGNITTETTIAEYEGPSSRPVMLSNGAVWTLAMETQKAGLVTINDAYFTIVCALHACGTLPSVTNFHHQVMKLARTIEANNERTHELEDLYTAAYTLCECEVVDLIDRNHWRGAGGFLEKVIWDCEKDSKIKSTYVEQLRALISRLAKNIVAGLAPPRDPHSKAMMVSKQSITTLVLPDLAKLLGEGRIPEALSLLSNGRYVNGADKAGITALEYAASTLCAPLVKLLLLYGAKVCNETNSTIQVNPVWWAVNKVKDNLEKEEVCAEIVALLINSGACFVSIPKHAESEGDALYLAARYGLFQIVEKLLEHPDTSSPSNSISSTACSLSISRALHGAMANTNGQGTKIAKLLIENGAEIDFATAKERHTYRPLHHAVSNEGPEGAALVELLLQLGAQVDFDSKFTTNEIHPFHLAVRNAGPKAVDIVQLLLDKGARIDTEDENGWQPLHHAARYNEGSGARAIVQLLLEKGAHGCIEAEDKKKERPLHKAVRNEGSEALRIVQLLLKDGTNIEAENIDRSRPLHCAVRNEGPAALNVVQLLLEKGAQTDAKDKWGYMAVDIVKEYVEPTKPDESRPQIAMLQLMQSKQDSLNLEP